MADGIVGAILMTIGMCVSAAQRSHTHIIRLHACARALALLCLTRNRDLPCHTNTRFIPCFSMVLFGHELFMYLTLNRHFASFLDGVSASVIGLIAETACQLTKVAVHTGMDTLVFTCALLMLNMSKNKNTPLLIIMAAAMAGQVLYQNGANQRETS
jgi:hypothetical protein